MVDLKGYEGEYAVTSCGKIWSYITQKFLATYFANGYEYTTLKDNTHIKISREVAKAYIPNPNNLPQVNHKDEIKAHNYVNNLEWCDAKYNVNYGGRNEKVRKAHNKKIYCKELKRTFESQKEAAAELGLDQGNISRVCRGKARTTGGYHFEFVKEGGISMEGIEEIKAILNTFPKKGEISMEKIEAITNKFPEDLKDAGLLTAAEICYDESIITYDEFNRVMEFLDEVNGQ